MFRTNGKPEGMVRVPAGSFMMGSDSGNDDESPAHKQIFDTDFFIDKTEVTQAAYQACVDDGVCNAATFYFAGDNKPVESVNWYQAAAYCKWKGARLPTEREWEYAARGPDNMKYPWGNNDPNSTLLNYYWNVGETTDVGSYPNGKSWVGALDMAGNVWEWTSSKYADYPYNKDDGRELTGGETSGVVGGVIIRGGDSFSSAYHTSTYIRPWVLPHISIIEGLIGFRCAHS